MKTLALKTLLHDWRRYAPAVVAVAFSGLLVLLQGAVILGIFSLSSLYVTRSSADLWVGFPGVQSIDLGRPIAAQAEMFIWMNPHVKRVEPFLWGSGQWRTERRGMVNVYIVGVDAADDAMALDDVLTPGLRARLRAPGAVLVDAGDIGKLGLQVGDTAEINGQRVRVVGATRGLRALGGVNVIASLATTRELDPMAGPGGDVAYFIARTDDPKAAPAVAADLNRTGRARGFEAMTDDRFAARTTRYWLVESGAGAAFVFGSITAVLVALVITSQTLAAAVAASLKEFAALRALGFSMGALRGIVVAQAAWVGVAGVALAGVLTVALVAAARSQGVPVVLSGGMMSATGALVVVVALVSGAFALRRVATADPATLLL
ncbi:ABC transporter permease [Phenylobacterium sp.]|uniref:ABC transporter permease n=1 Tax=Phenylobacterium sp. TaxID=1871053 RepID=UPI002F4177CE